MAFPNRQYPPRRYGNALRLQNTQWAKIDALSGAMGTWSLILPFHCAGSQVGITGDSAGAYLFQNRHTLANSFSLRLVLEAGGANILVRTVTPGPSVNEIASVPVATFLARKHQLILKRLAPISTGTGRITASFDGAAFSTAIEANNVSMDTWASGAGFVGAFFGANGLGGGYHTDTRIPEAILVAGDISATDAARLYNARNGSYYFETMLSALPVIARWNMEAITSGEILDESGNARDLVLTASPTLITY